MNTIFSGFVCKINKKMSFKLIVNIVIKYFYYTLRIKIKNQINIKYKVFWLNLFTFFIITFQWVYKFHNNIIVVLFIYINK